MIPKLTIRDDFHLELPLALAPMVGLSHCGLRSLIAELGGCGLFFTEMLAAKRLPSENPLFSAYLHKTDIDDPLFYQLFLGDESYVAKAVAKIESLDGAGIDLNLGCPAPNVKKGGAGAALAQDLPRVKRVVKELRKNTKLVLSAKIRLGHPGKENDLIEFARMLEDEGVELITIHARYHGEKFCRRPRWHEIGQVKEAVKVPIIANGGIFSVSDARTCLERSGADGLMIGRGGVEKPWLFAEIAEEIYKQNMGEIDKDPASIYFRFLQQVKENFAIEKRLSRIKQFTHYLASNHPFGHHLASKVQSSQDLSEAICHAEKFYGMDSRPESFT
ncbi:MAG: tRNA-dihydrouridine synthase family protein [Desulfotalea sp.]